MQRQNQRCLWRGVEFGDVQIGKIQVTVTLEVTELRKNVG